MQDLQGIGQYQVDGTCDGASIVSCGQWHTIVVAGSTNEVYGWGWNKYGQLGPNIENDDDDGNDDDDDDDDNHERDDEVNDDEVGDHRNRYDDNHNLQSRKRRRHFNKKCSNSNSDAIRFERGRECSNRSSSRSISFHSHDYTHRDEVISHPRCLTNAVRKCIYDDDEKDNDHDDHAVNHSADDDYVNDEDTMEYLINEVLCGSDYTAIVYHSSVRTSSSIVIM